ncbi:MAG: hypothetical protein GX217_02545 [Clostridiaceae bacterium]|nr:hypothetical protein [Clostridiaceae bacterium]
MSKKKAYIFYGGYDGHEPDKVSLRFKNMLEKEGFDVLREDNMDRLDDLEFLKSLDLIVPMYTQGVLKDSRSYNLTEAVMSGVGLAGAHGGMNDAFRWNVEWQFLTGSQWVAHPGDNWCHHISTLSDEDMAYVHEHYPDILEPHAYWTTYTVNFKKNSTSPLIKGLEDFEVFTEQYYIHVDPAIDVLATTRVKSKGPHAANGEVEIPVAYTRLWGEGRVFYQSMGHVDTIFDIYQVSELQRRGFLWASKSEID